MYQSPNYFIEEIASSAQKQEEVDKTMRSYLFYEQVKVDGPRKKIMELQAIEKIMDSKELEVFEKLCDALADKEKYYDTTVDECGSQLLLKLIELPV